MKGKKYECKGKVYEVIHRANLKNPHTGEWIKSVVYKPVDGLEIYVRVEWDFIQKFKRVEVKV